MSLNAELSELKAVVEFLDGLTELSNRTGVMASAHAEMFVEFGNQETLGIASRRDDNGRITYYIDDYDA